MDELNMNSLLNRNEIEMQLIQSLNYFEENKSNVLTKRGIYIYGSQVAANHIL